MATKLPAFKTSDIKNEKGVKEQIKRVLTTTAQCWWFMPPTNGYGRSGIPDFVGMVNGHAFAVEAKSGNGALSPHQVREIEAITQAGGKVWVVRELNLRDFDLEFAGWAAVCS